MYEFHYETGNPTPTPTPTQRRTPLYSSQFIHFHPSKDDSCPCKNKEAQNKTIKLYGEVIEITPRNTQLLEKTVPPSFYSIFQHNARNGVRQEVRRETQKHLDGTQSISHSITWELK